MGNLKIGFLLHFYQPWWQFPYVLKEIVNRCYYPILKLVEETPGFCFSANVNYSLLELLDSDYTEPLNGFILDHDFRYIISRFKKAAKEKKIELLGSMAYHPIVPLIPKNMQMTQMLVDSQFKRVLWGIERNCEGIFLPEMAFSQNIIGNLREYDYEWTVIDDEPFRVQYGCVLFDKIASLQDFKILMRSNYWSNQIACGRLKSFDAMVRKMEYEISQWTHDNSGYLIISLDAETFGYHHQNLIENFLEPMMKKWGSTGKNILTPLNEILRTFPLVYPVEGIINGSWSTAEQDIRKGDYFPLWNSKFNPHHYSLWRLVNIALQYAERPEAGWDCMKIVSSCHWWWISQRSGWKPEFMKFGARKAMGIIERFGDQMEKDEAKNIFEKLDPLQ